MPRTATVRAYRPALSIPSSRPAPANPILKWAGGKRWLLPYLGHRLDPHRNQRLVEPFAGGLAVSLGHLPRNALLNDINAHVINLYSQIRDGLTIRLSLKNDEATYYRYRDRFNELIAAGKADTSLAASLFYYLNRTGFNGLCRFNRSGLFNVPYGKYKKVAYRSSFPEIKDIFADWTFSSKDFAELRLRETDVVYADPPYDVEFTSYSAGGFSWEDQIRVAEWCATHPGPVFLSNQATPRIVKLYKSLGFEIDYLVAPRRISCNGDRTPTQEVLATKTT